MRIPLFFLLPILLASPCNAANPPASPEKTKTQTSLLKRVFSGESKETGKAAPAKTSSATPNAQPVQAPEKPSAPSVPDDYNFPATEGLPSLNAWIIAMASQMPQGGSYSTSSKAMAGLSDAIRMNGGTLAVNPAGARPSFCSSATYLVFVWVLERLQHGGHITMTPQDAETLLVRGQADGFGIWGRWNANGPGTARLFHELGMGRNFTSFDEALPGDFLKIFWNQNIGKNERGHSVIYLGKTTLPDGSPAARFWSANQPNGYGIRTVPMSKIQRALFSRMRLPDPSRFQGLPARDEYLASMLRRDSSAEEMLRAVGAN